MPITKILNRSEFGYDEVENIAKIGDGVSTFDELTPFNKTEVLNNLNSIRTDAALSANQGKVLNDKITLVNNSIDHIELIVGTSEYTESKTVPVRVNEIEGTLGALQLTISNIETNLSSAQSNILTLQTNVSTNQNNINSNITKINNIETIVGTENYNNEKSIAQRTTENEEKIIILMSGAHISKN